MQRDTRFDYTVNFYGQLDSKGSYKNGKKEGEWVIYWGSNGRLASKENYKNGKREGVWTEYHSEGQLHLKGNYKNGEWHGEFSFYYQNGVASSELTGTYKNNDKISE